MSRIPEARDRQLIVVAALRLLADQHKIDALLILADELCEIHNLMIRESPISRASATERLTREKADKILAMHEENPNLGYKEIAEEVGVGIGRVSEVLTGLRYPKK